MAHLMGAEVITHEFPTKEVFSGVTVGINDGDRIGIVGRNGDGKSTLVKILTKQFAPDSGRVTWRGGLRIGFLNPGGCHRRRDFHCRGGSGGPSRV